MGRAGRVDVERMIAGDGAGGVAGCAGIATLGSPNGIARLMHACELGRTFAGSVPFGGTGRIGGLDLLDKRRLWTDDGVGTRRPNNPHGGAKDGDGSKEEERLMVVGNWHGAMMHALPWFHVTESTRPVPERTSAAHSGHLDGDDGVRRVRLTNPLRAG